MHTNDACDNGNDRDYSNSNDDDMIVVIVTMMTIMTDGTEEN